MFLQSILNGVVAGALAPALWGSTRTLSFGMGCLLALGALASFMHQRLTLGESRP
jgi:DHA1 family bicyclomycin/chloramphenicol resistance-like MFS transporter